MGAPTLSLHGRSRAPGQLRDLAAAMLRAPDLAIGHKHDPAALDPLKEGSAFILSPLDRDLELFTDADGALVEVRQLESPAIVQQGDFRAAFEGVTADSGST